MVYQNPILALQRFAEHFKGARAGPADPRPPEGAPASVFDALPLGDSGRDPGLLLVEHHVPEAQVAGSTPPASPPPSAEPDQTGPYLMFTQAGVRQLSTCGHRQFSHGNLSRSALDTVGLMQLLIATVLAPV
ncbi:hypothetical protein Q5P01_000230 [Channa striata]|uniref:Uncharacterized protein n=1 Tax=Channa striata TaxID=64152 RepID=A0AA88IHJ1_CHASR|nr:hypothetical protein Q5P01_000230 [Channa striata]